MSNPVDLSTAIYAPSITNEYLAGFGKFVIQAAKAKDRVAREILVEAGKELGLAATAVIRNLKLERETFPVGYVGGVFAASGELVLSHLREALAGNCAARISDAAEIFTGRGRRAHGP